ncbi:unnamed protein product, partial [Urochloa humidicola]
REYISKPLLREHIKRLTSIDLQILSAQDVVRCMIPHMQTPEH